MRLFPCDDVPGLSIYPEEMRPPWILPAFPRPHRDRLAALVCRAVRSFDPRVRVVSLRWIERTLLESGQMTLPEQPLISWSISGRHKGQEVLRTAPAVANALHLFDFEEAPEMVALGWLAQLKVNLLHRITDVLVKERPLRDPEPVLDVLDGAAERLVSPIDLLDLAERVIETHAAGMPIADAEAEGYAVVIAGRFVPPRPSESPPVPLEVRGAADVFVAALEACAREETLSEAAHVVLARHAFVEPGFDGPPPMLEALKLPRPIGRLLSTGDIIDRVAWRVGGARGRPVPEVEPRPAPEVVDESVEAEAQFVLASLRTKRDRDWSDDRRAEAASTLQRFAEETQKARGEKLTSALLEREASLLQTASELLERAGERGRAARAACESGARWFDAERLDEALEAAQRALALAESVDDPRTRANAFLSIGSVHWYRDLFEPAEEAAESALQIFQTLGDRAGEGNALLLRTRIREYRGLSEGSLADAATVISLFEAAGDRVGEARARDFRARVLGRKGDARQALADIDAGLQVVDGPGMLRARGRLLATRGELHRSRDRLPEAIADLMAAVRIFEELEERRDRAGTLHSLVVAQRMAGDVSAAASHLEEALSLSQQVKDLGVQARALADRATLRLQGGDLDRAAEDNNVATRLSQQTGDADLRAWTMLTAARLAQARGDLGGALAKYEEARGAFERLGSAYNAASALALEADALVAADRVAEARVTALRALAIAQERHNSAARHLAGIVLTATSDAESREGEAEKSTSGQSHPRRP